MSSPISAPSTVRCFLRWVLIVTGVCLIPFEMLALVAVSYFTLDSAAVTLRRQVMASTRSDWSTKIQLSVGRSTIEAVDFGLGFVKNERLADVRLAMAAIKRASVGVYERSALLPDNRPLKELFAETDRVMHPHGWSRLVGVMDQKDTVLIYVPEGVSDEASTEVCLAVISGRELVIASTRLNPDALAKLVKQKTPDSFKNQLRLAMSGSI